MPVRPALLMSLVAAATLLSACLTEINKPIRPGDPWRDRAAEMSNPMGVD